MVWYGMTIPRYEASRQVGCRWIQVGETTPPGLSGRRVLGNARGGGVTCDLVAGLVWPRPTPLAKLALQGQRLGKVYDNTGAGKL